MKKKWDPLTPHPKSHMTLREMQQAAAAYHYGCERGSDPFAYSRAMSHMLAGVAGLKDGRADYGQDRHV